MEENTLMDDTCVKYRNSGLSSTLAEKLAIELEVCMISEKLFRQSNLRLPSLAQHLKTRLHYVSQVINQFHQISFAEYLNRKRIEEAKSVLRQSTQKEFRIMEVAYLVGYNNKNSFNKAFKRLTGQTPTQYRQLCKEPC